MTNIEKLVQTLMTLEHGDKIINVLRAIAEAPGEGTGAVPALMDGDRT